MRRDNPRKATGQHSARKTKAFQWNGGIEIDFLSKAAANVAGRIEASDRDLVNFVGDIEPSQGQNQRTSIPEMVLESQLIQDPMRRPKVRISSIDLSSGQICRCSELVEV